jgi:hypothetical protein
MRGSRSGDAGRRREARCKACVAGTAAAAGSWACPRASRALREAASARRTGPQALRGRGRATQLVSGAAETMTAAAPWDGQRVPAARGAGAGAGADAAPGNLFIGASTPAGEQEAGLDSAEQDSPPSASAPVRPSAASPVRLPRSPRLASARIPSRRLCSHASASRALRRVPCYPSQRPRRCRCRRIAAVAAAAAARAWHRPPAASME